MSGQRVGVVGDASLAAAVEDAGGRPVVGPPDEFDDVAFVVASGETALVECARQGVGAPVLPVDAGRGVRSVPATGGADAVERVLAGEYRTERRPVVSTGTGERALFDVALMAAEPARISEFSVRHDGEPIAQFRADGVVASTPAGSVGYNRSADGPVVAPGTGVVAVVPIAPFATDADRWVLPTAAVTLAVERDETPVELLADGRPERTVATDDPVTLTSDDGIETVVLPESEEFF
ncbi:ATP-NAD kinase [Natronomonas marina]|jgi:NAD+ kinase|uniref:ATP-NAD kinase n=1 Tax=Natronomonas marina TaxID=2961939 RepID=UPI0020CA0553|nr:ATP-NAD kinase [Natronomonas marina]